MLSSIKKNKHSFSSRNGMEEQKKIDCIEKTLQTSS